jgi:TatA/E family protein of Tat protein translocase
MNLLFTLLLFEDISGGELMLILLAVFLLFGPSKIPEIAKGIAKGIHDIKKATSSVSEEINKNIDPIKKELRSQVDELKNELKMDDNAAKNTTVGTNTEKPFTEQEKTKNEFSG